MGVVTNIEDVIENIEDAIYAIDKVEPMQATHYNWFSLDSSNRRLFTASEQLRVAQKTLNEAINDRVDAYVIDRTLAALMNDVKACDRILDQTSGKDRDALSAVFTIWWNTRWSIPIEMTPAVETAIVSYLRSYVAAKEQDEKDELEDLIRLHS